MSNIENTKTGFFPGSKTTNLRTKKGTDVLLRRNSPERADEISQTSKRDARVEIPDAIKDFAKIKSAVDQVPDRDNSEKIAMLKQQIEAGTYDVDYDELADRILNEEMN